jgi:hydrogenase/urease accessory protein HupE
MIRRLLPMLLIICCAIGGQHAAAHAIGLSRGVYQSTADGLTATLSFAHTELASAIPEIDSNADGSISGNELLTHRSVLARFLLDGLTLSSADGACRGTMTDAELTDNDGLRAVLQFACAAVPNGYALQFGLFDRLSPGHRHFATTLEPSESITRIVYRAQPAIVLKATERAATARIGWPIFKLGIEHILTGYDHLVFLLGLLIVTRRLRDLLLVVTAFTLGHSITLGVATLGLWIPSPNMIEALIALSIVYVGVENCLTRKDARRWPLTLGFGLVHGFGFAGVLSEIELPSAQLPLALLSFNIGVEIGQLMILAIATPAVFWLRRKEWFAQHGVRAMSVAIALAGLGWFIQRVV